MASLAGGVSVAVIPAATLAIGSHVFTVAENGFIAVDIMVATFIGQLTFAAVVESRLSSSSTARRVVFPLWLAILGVLAALAIAFNPTNALVLCICLPILLAALEVGRGVSVAERLDTREIIASVAVGLGALLGVLSALGGITWGLTLLVAGIVVATALRSLPVAHTASRPDSAVRAWVVLDVGITGIVFPLLNIVILALLGPTEAVIFTAISTVSGLLAIPLNFLRLRLLKEHSVADIWITVSSLLLAIVALLIAEFVGLFSVLFGSAWTLSDTLVPLLIACGWRAASLAPTLPFTALRRLGHARLVTILRAVASAISFALGGLALVSQNVAWVFAALLAAELLSGLLYELARRRLGRPETRGVGNE
jgi:hypothetical protein